MRILFVCTANIHRSALAEAILRALAQGAGRDDVEVDSAGVAGLDDEPAAPGAVRAAAAGGFNLSRHRSRAVTRAMLREADMILVMERAHRDHLAVLEPDSAGRCRLLSEYAPPGCVIEPRDDVPDAGMDETATFERSFSIVKQCVEALWKELPPPPEEIYTRSIEERFRRHRGAPIALSPVDWETIERWWESGVPLWLVLTTLDEAFSRRRPGQGGRPRRLSWFVDDIDERFEAYRKGRVTPGEQGDAPAGRADDEEAPCRMAARRLEEAGYRAAAAGHAQAAALLKDARREVRALESERDPAALIRSLDGLEQRLLTRLRDAIDPAEMARLQDEAADRLAPHRERMSPDAFEATVTRLVDGRIREIFSLPSLTQP